MTDDINSQRKDHGATFDSDISGLPLPDTSTPDRAPRNTGFDNAHDSGSRLPLSSDKDPIDEFEDDEDFSKSAPLRPASAESPDTHADAGLLSMPGVEDQAQTYDAAYNDLPATDVVPGDDELLSLESGDLDENLTEVEVSGEVKEIPLADLDVESIDDPVARDTIRAPDMDAPDTPGQIDIEALGDGDIEHLLPPDARLDPIEE